MAKALKEGEPVAGFGMRYSWHGGDWERLFNAQIDYVKRDVIRARTADKLVVYLSCPISSRGGGFSGANVDIALASQRYLLDRWGEGAWILNPANYQMESRAGTGLMNMHAARLGINLDELIARDGMPTGGDYMRMWTQVLVENDQAVGRATVSKELVNTGQYFDAYYFLGPSDVHRFFRSGEETLTASIETYFARRMESDPLFRDVYSVDGMQWGQLKGLSSAQEKLRDDWRLRRAAFARFYMFRAGVNYSLGSHDEWNIWKLLNARRRKAPDGGIGEQIAGFFEGAQIACSSTEIGVSPGYELT